MGGVSSSNSNKLPIRIVLVDTAHEDIQQWTPNNNEIQLRIALPCPSNDDFVREAKFIRDPAKLPIVYSHEYNISFFHVERVLQGFDLEKYGNVFKKLSSCFKFSLDQIHCPESPVSDEDLRLVHTISYLDSLSDPWAVSRIADVPALALCPISFLQTRLLTPMRYATQGTIMAAELALSNGWAINLGGGFHHAKASKGEGVCAFADIPLSIRKLMSSNREIRSVLIVDLDAHQGNGLTTIYTSPNNVATSQSATLKYSFSDSIHIFDMYNGDIFPKDSFSRRFISYDFPLSCHTESDAYLKILNENLPIALNACKPDIVFFNAGTDIFVEDPLGQLCITRDAIIARDELVFRQCKLRNIPIVMLLSGGFTLKSADIISASIENLNLKDLISLSV